MAESDSGVDTGSESNESNSMSIGSPCRSDEDKYFQELKEKLTSKECIVLADFAENYTFTIQDEIRSYHWNNNQQDIVDYSEKSLPSYSNENAPIDITKILHDFAFREYGQEEFIGKLKRRKAICLLKHSSIPKLKHIIGERKLRTAANTNDVETVRGLLDIGINPCAADNRQRTALHFAAAGGHAEVARLLLERGADPNQRDSVGNTPLHLAACTSHIEMVTLLLKAGTDINALDYSGRSPLHLAQSKLKLLQMNKEYSSAQIKTEVTHVLEMMQVYLQRSGRCGEDLINAFSNRLHHHQTREEVDNDVSDLLSSLSHLSLQASS